jgi:hypothetical protein
LGECSEIETVPAACVEDDVSRSCVHEIGDGVEERLGYATIVESSAGCDGGRGIARLQRPALLRLEQVDVAATRDVKRMTSGTAQLTMVAQECEAAIADRAEEHASSVAKAWRLSRMTLRRIGAMNLLKNRKRQIRYVMGVRLDTVRS